MATLQYIFLVPTVKLECFVIFDQFQPVTTFGWKVLVFEALPLQTNVRLKCFTRLETNILTYLPESS